MARGRCGKRTVRELPWSRAIDVGASACVRERSPAGYRTPWPVSDGSVRAGDLLGAPGGARAAHIMQFRPVGVKRPCEEMLPESLEFSERRGLSVAAGCLGGKGRRSDRCHDAASFFIRGFAAGRAFFCAENEFWPDLLKDSFNCRDSPHTWCPPRIHPW